MGMRERQGWRSPFNYDRGQIWSNNWRPVIFINGVSSWGVLFLYSDLECPYCESFTTLEDCDNDSTTQDCQPKNVCFVRKKMFGPTPYFMRGCIKKKTAKGIQSKCKKGSLVKNDCHFNICKGKGCKASLPIDNWFCIQRIRSKGKSQS